MPDFHVTLLRNLNGIENAVFPNRLKARTSAARDDEEEILDAPSPCEVDVNVFDVELLDADHHSAADEC